MAQNYSNNYMDQTARDAIYISTPQNFEVLRSSWSGDSFPENPVVGQPCYRLDEDRLYYWDGEKWSEKGGGGGSLLPHKMFFESSNEPMSSVTLTHNCDDEELIWVFAERTLLPPTAYSYDYSTKTITFTEPVVGLSLEVRWFEKLFSGDYASYDVAGSVILATEEEIKIGSEENKVVTARGLSSGVGVKPYSSQRSYPKNDVVLNVSEEGIVKLYQSLVDNNLGNELIDDSSWKAVSLGGVSGGQVGDIGVAINVDETTWLRRKLNGQVIDINANTQAFYNYLTGLQATNPNLFATESEWQSIKTSSKLGQCGKFVIDTEAQTIRLPAIANINGLLASGLAGNLINERLPNVRGSTGISVPNNSSVAGAFKAGISKTVASLGTQTTATVLDFDASEWSSTYQNDASVQQEAVQYPFFIQINTGSETTSDITNEQELNNPFSFGDSKYTTIELNNISWLRSQGQWNPKTTYPDYYDWVLTNANSNVELFKLSTETYTEYDWVVDTTDETFRLPLKTKQAPVQSGNIPVFGNGMTLGITNGTYNYGTQSGSGGYIGFFQTKLSLYGATNGTTGGTPDGSGQIAVGITTDPTKSGIKAIVEEQTGLHLYFYVGETVQNANLIDAGRIAEQFPNKADIDLSNVSGNIDYVVEKVIYEEGRSGYLRLKSGILIQWGLVYYGSTSGFKTVTFNKPFKNIPIVVGNITGSSYMSPIGANTSQGSQTVEPTYFTTYADANIPYKAWIAIGQGA